MPKPKKKRTKHYNPKKALCTQSLSGILMDALRSPPFSTPFSEKGYGRTTCSSASLRAAILPESSAPSPDSSAPSRRSPTHFPSRSRSALQESVLAADSRAR